jgi:hypothetical protein
MVRANLPAAPKRRRNDMSKDALAKVVQRAISDAAFRRQLNSDPTGALRGFDLSTDELSALRTGDAGRLSTLGIDQRMSKAFAIGGALASTRMSQSDLTPGGGPAMVDDMSGAGGRTVIPADPTRAGGSADVDGGSASGTNTVRVGDDYKFAGRQAPDGSGTGTVRAGDDWKFEGRVAPESAGAVRTGDDWKFADRAASQGGVAPVDGSPEATAADISTGSGMANYPAHDGLAGPSQASSMANYPAHDGLAGPSQVTSARAGDDWARSSAADADSGRIGSARLDDASGAANRANVIHDDPNGFLAANADAGGSVTRANVIHDDPNGFLAANANVDTSGSVRAINDDPDGFLAANANADATGTVSRGDGTAFIDESEAYLTKVGYDSSTRQTEVTDAHDRTYSGDDIAGPSTDSTSAGEGTAADHGDSSLTP